MAQQTIATTDSPETGRGKINDNFHDILTAFGGSTTAFPKRYVALVSQSGTSAPTATVLENTLGGTVVWGYTSVGAYTATLASAFTENKTTLYISQGQEVVADAKVVGIGRASANVISVVTGIATSGENQDAILSGATISITVYP